MFKDLLEHYIESVFVLNNVWFHDTAFDAFYHGDPKYDDCADKSKYGYQETPKAYVPRKTRFNIEFFEVY